MFNRVLEWKHQAGLAATATAILLALMWGRSYFASEIIQMPIGYHDAIGIVSCGGRVAWCRTFRPVGTYRFPCFPGRVAIKDDEDGNLLGNDFATFSFRFRGFGIGKSYDTDRGSEYTFYLVLYWFLTLPTALAAYLLLSDSKNSQKDTADAPQSEEASNLSRRQVNQTVTQILLECFRGWKRKAGLVTLVMACLFAAFWSRSLTIMDALYTDALNIVSYQEAIVIARTYKDRFSFPRWETMDHLLDLESELGPDFKWSLQFCGFGCGSFGDKACACLVPHWSITFALTLLSGYLLLSEPRKPRPSSHSKQPSTE